MEPSVGSSGRTETRPEGPARTGAGTLSSRLPWSADTGLLVLRLVLATSFIAHGSQKVFGAFHGMGIHGFAHYLAANGFKDTLALSWLNGMTELVAGVALAIGLFTPLAAAGILAVMINSFLLKFHNGFFFQDPGGFEIDVALGGMALGVLLIGPGRIAVDAVVPRLRRVLAWRPAFLVFGVASALVVRFFLR